MTPTTLRADLRPIAALCDLAAALRWQLTACTIPIAAGVIPDRRSGALRADCADLLAIADELSQQARTDLTALGGEA